jgi:hypothetical protein
MYQPAWEQIEIHISVHKFGRHLLSPSRTILITLISGLSLASRQMRLQGSLESRSVVLAVQVGDVSVQNKPVLIAWPNLKTNT